MADPASKGAAPASRAKRPPEVVCEPGRHVGCLHAKMAEKRAAAKSGR